MTIGEQIGRLHDDLLDMGETVPREWVIDRLGALSFYRKPKDSAPEVDADGKERSGSRQCEGDTTDAAANAAFDAWWAAQPKDSLPYFEGKLRNQFERWIFKAGAEYGRKAQEGERLRALAVEMRRDGIKAYQNLPELIWGWADELERIIEGETK